MDTTPLVARWQAAYQDIAAAASACGRSPRDITLVAVSKFHPLEAITALADAGQMDFGENYLQEAQEKLAASPSHLRWHFIGHLQTNKANAAAGKFSLIHGVDSVKLARRLHKKSEELGICQRILVQVNVAGEEQKSGVAENELPELLEQVLQLSCLRVDGLMLMPPIQPDPEKSRPFFARLRELKEENEARFHVSLPHLSMGMTSDFAIAIAEGATLVRIGTRIFGPRPVLSDR